MKSLEQTRRELADAYAEKVVDSPLAGDPVNVKVDFIEGFDAALKHLSEQVEFDATAAEKFITEWPWKVPLDGLDGKIELCRWMHSQMAARVGIEKLRVDNIARERNDLEAQVAELKAELYEATNG